MKIRKSGNCVGTADVYDDQLDISAKLHGQNLRFFFEKSDVEKSVFLSAMSDSPYNIILDIL